MSTDVKTGPIPTVHDPSMIARLLCEMLGTLWLVFGGAGSAVFAASQIQEGNINMGLGYLGVALAFGLTVFTGAYSFGTFSGGHFNPAVTIGLAVGRRFRWRDVPGYIVAQVIGGLLAGGLIYIIASGKDGFEATGSMAANGYGAHSPTATAWRRCSSRRSCSPRSSCGSSSASPTSAPPRARPAPSSAWR